MMRRALTAELGDGVLEQPHRGGLAVVGPGRVRVLGGEAVVDAHDRHVEAPATTSLSRSVISGSPMIHPPPWIWRNTAPT